MPISHDDFLASSQIPKDGASEVIFRNSISRAYYAAYHKCLSLALEYPIGPHGGELPNVGVHRTLSSRFSSLPKRMAKNNEHHLKLRQLGIILKVLHDRRLKADYELLDDVSKKLADQHLIEVNRFFALCDGLLLE